MALLPLALLLAAAAPIADLPMLEDHGHVFVAGSVGSTSGLWLALDTGASASVLDADLARRLGIEAGERGQAGGAGGVVETAVARGVAVSLPGVPLGRLDLDTLPLGPISSRQGAPIALVLGYELFSRFAVELDYENGRLRLWDPGSYLTPADATSLPIDIVHNHPYVEATVRSRGGATIQGRFVIDLGSAQSVILTPRVVEEHRLLLSTPTLQGRAGGVGGTFAIHTGRVASLQVGPFTVRDVVAVLPLGGVVADAEGAAGNLGGGFLRRFRVVLDYSRRRMLLMPNDRFDEGDEADMSGLALLAHGDGLREVAIERVRDGSPGAEAGLRAGDRILAVDGTPLADFALWDLRERFRRAGEHRLTVLRGEERLELVLRTRRQI
jgi:hypothetical protein